MVAVTFANSVSFGNSALGIPLAEANPIGCNVCLTDNAPASTNTAHCRLSRPNEQSNMVWFVRRYVWWIVVKMKLLASQQ